MGFGTELSRQLDTVAGLPRKDPYQDEAASDRGAARRIAYILNAKTGASVNRVAKLAGVTPATVRKWQAGGAPSKASRGKINRVYRKFLDTNNRARVSSRAAKVAKAVQGNKLHLMNSEGDDRFYGPASRWNYLVQLWEDGDTAGMDAWWDGVISYWDYPDPWDAAIIDIVEIT